MEQVHSDGQKSNSSSKKQKKDHHPNSIDLKNNHDENEQDNDLFSKVTINELNKWIKELNNFDCYLSIQLSFTMDIENDKIIIHLKDKNGHNLQDYLPLQIKSLYYQIKKDIAEIPKGTILNISC